MKSNYALKLYRTETLQIEISDNDNSIENNVSNGRPITSISRHSDSVRERTVSQTSEHISTDLIQQS